MTPSPSIAPEPRAWCWPVLLALTIFFVSGQSRVAAPPLIGIDKLAHFAVFGLLATLLARCPGVSTFKPLGLGSAIVATSLYGLFDEVRQSLTPGRDVGYADWVADTAGAIVAVGLYARWGAYRRVLEWRRAAVRPLSSSP